ncbi:response regulator transcription factor [Cupriavidus pampae]|uniref:Protein-glutamate methylesterase/protein-glutamine glutaminase n=1 Tax=Cupriavidus pampae TaxID=659251 RepID=A0ABM8XZ90_9BURK|nr:response regulator [Cupriavidus pampae]CAG9185777.1 Protein-glutamate methylesterase/protein-glutamine glutaminase [Cupriavidus pampae]
MHSSFEPIETVMVVDDEVAVRMALSRLFRSVDLRVLLFASAEELLATSPPEGPSCLVLDVRLQGISGLALQSVLMESRRPLPIVFISGIADVPMAVAAMKAGAVDFIEKPFRDQQLLEAVHQALRIDIDRYKKNRASEELRRKYLSLTPREKDVMELITRGLLNKQAADHLGLSIVTVKIYRRGVMRKMTASSFADLVRMKDLVEQGTLLRYVPDDIRLVLADEHEPVRNLLQRSGLEAAESR